MGLSTDAAARKAVPIVTGCLDYFPDALCAIAELSRIGGQQHNPGLPLFWDRDKSGDEADALGRHLMQRGTFDTDGVRHSAKVAWRALALLQKELEASRTFDSVEEIEAAASQLTPATVAALETIGQADAEDNVGELKAGEAHR